MRTVIVPDYLPGTWVAVVTDGGVALLPAGTDHATVHRLWTSMRADATALVRHLQEITRDGLSALPPFALVAVADQRLHAVLRGDVELDVRVSGRTRVLTAPDVATWSEQVATDVESVTVRAPGAAAPVDGTGLPLVSGVAHVDAVRLVLRDAAAPADRAPAAEDVAGPDHPAGHDEPDDLGGAVDLAPVALPPVGDPFDHTVLRPAPVEETRPAPDPDVALRDLLAAERAGAEHPDAHAADDDLAPADAVLADLTAVPAVSDVPAVPDPSTDLSTDASTDHDGTTVLSSEVLALRERLPDWAGHALLAPRTTGPGAPAAGAATATLCAPSALGTAEPAPSSATAVTPATTTRTAPARLAMSTGERVPLTRPVLIGRAPQAARVNSTQVPRLVTVPSPLQDISRTHAEVRMDGDDVVLTDLRSTNGVVVVRCDTGPQRLQPGVPTVLAPGSLVDLGEDVTFTVERGA